MNSLLASLSFPAMVVAALPQELPRMEVVLRDGTRQTVSVLGLEEDRVRMRGTVAGTPVIFVARLDELEPLSSYAILRTAQPPRGYDDHMAMAAKTAAWDLVAPTVQHLEAAVRAAAAEPGAAYRIARTRAFAVAWRETIVRAALADGDLELATGRLGVLTVELTDAFADERLDSLTALVDAARAERGGARATATAATAALGESARIDRTLAPLRADLDRAERRLEQARLAANRTVEAARHAAAAQRMLAAVERRLARIEQRLPEGAARESAVAGLRARVREGLLQALLQEASARTFQSDFRGAIQLVERALAIDGQHAEALSLRHTILIANAVSGPGWIGGGVVPTPQRY